MGAISNAKSMWAAEPAVWWRCRQMPQCHATRSPPRDLRRCPFSVLIRWRCAWILTVWLSVKAFFFCSISVWFAIDCLYPDYPKFVFLFLLSFYIFPFFLLHRV